MYRKVFSQTDVDQALNQRKWTLPLSVLLWYPHEGAFRYYFFASRLAHFVIPFWFASRTFAIELLWHHLRICRTSFSKINVVENNGYSVYQALNRTSKHCCCPLCLDKWAHNKSGERFTDIVEFAQSRLSSFFSHTGCIWRPICGAGIGIQTSLSLSNSSYTTVRVDRRIVEYPQPDICQIRDCASTGSLRLRMSDCKKPGSFNSKIHISHQFVPTSKQGYSDSEWVDWQAELI